jgi:hypothetical protein
MFVVVFVGLDRRRSEKDVVGEEPDIFALI